MAKDARSLSKVEKNRLKELGERARAIRLQKNLTLEEVEGRGYPSWKHLQALEYGRKNITITSLFRLAEALEIKPEEILKNLK